jgi:hypothetical protein
MRHGLKAQWRRSSEKNVVVSGPVPASRIGDSCLWIGPEIGAGKLRFAALRYLQLRHECAMEKK